MHFIEINTKDLIELVTGFWNNEPKQFLTNEEISSLIAVDKMYFGDDGEILVTKKIENDVYIKQDPIKEVEEIEISFCTSNSSIVDEVNEGNKFNSDPIGIPTDDFETNEESDYSMSDVEADFLLPTPSFEHLYKKLDNDLYGCVKCDKTATESVRIISHAQMHVERSCLCTFCGRVFKSTSFLKQHELIHTQQSKSAADNKFQCDDENVNEAIDYMQEVRKHNRGRVKTNRECQYCGRSDFKSNVRFYDHLNVHTKEAPYHCSCGSKMRSQTNYLTHIKQFGCSREGAILPQYQIDSSLKMRANRKPPLPLATKINKKKVTSFPNGYICDTCGAQFSNASQLKKHKDLKHLVRTIPCTVADCKLLFSTELLLKIHLKSHYELSKCEHCSRIMPTRKLPDHIRRLHSAGNFPCDQCDYVGRVKSHLYVHIRKEHCKVTLATCIICQNEFEVRGMHFKKTSHILAEKMWMQKYKITEYPCGRCKDSNFQTMTEVMEHLNKVHRLGNVACMEYLKTLEDGENRVP